MSETHMPELLPLAEARARLGGIGHTYCYELINRGEITKIKLGKRSFVTGDSIAAFINRRITEQAAAS